MSLSRADRFATALGFDPADNYQRACLAPAFALAATLAALPLLLLLPLDTDRALSLAFLPAYFLGWRLIKPANPIDKSLFTWALGAMLLSTAWSSHAARALVMTAAVGWVFAGALIAQSLSRCIPAVRLLMAGIVAGALAGVLLVYAGVATDRMFFPTYWSARLFGGHEFAGCVAVLVLLRLTPSRSATKVALITAAIIIWTGLAWSGSRAPALGLAVTLAVWFWRGKKTDRRFLLRWVPALSALALACSYPLGTPYPQLGWWPAITRSAQATNAQQITSSRTDYWVGSWQQIKKSPAIGSGADAYLFLTPKQPGNQPHSTPIQWLLEYGILGLLPLMALLARSILPLFHRTVRTSESNLGTWMGAAMAGALVYGLFDGVFYHMIIFMPVAVFAGLALGQIPAPENQTGTTTLRIPTIAARALLLVALIVLLIHNWLGLMLLHAQGVTPDSLPASILRTFPSQTHGLQNWLNSWHRTDPELTLNWIHWAEKNSPTPGAFHVYAAQLFIWEKNWRAAELEMLSCLDKVSALEKPDVQEVINNVRRLAAEQAAQTTPSP